MDTSRRSSQAATDSGGPLLPVHTAPGQRPLSSGSGDPPTSPSFSQPLRVREPALLVGQQQEETDIAEHHPAHVQEKIGVVVSPTRQNTEYKSASVEEEQQAIDWIVPVQNGGPQEKRRTVEERLRSTLEIAKSEQLKYETRAKYAGMAINGAMFAQIISNALITGLSASSSNRKAQIGVSALGALGTIISSFLVRVRGTREPERSVTHAQNLEKFIRELEAFILDEGLSRDRKWDDEVKRFRVEFDKMQTAVHQSENGQPMSEKT